jgi:NAD(P)H-dependent FMN reductase
MSNRIPVFYGTCRSESIGIWLAEYVVKRVRRRGEDVELIDAKATNLRRCPRV